MNYEVKFYEPDEELMKPIRNVLTPFLNSKVDEHPLFKELNSPPEFGDWRDEQKKYDDTNIWVLWDEIQCFESYDPDVTEWKRAMINMLKLRLLLYATNPYFRSRIGYDLWFSNTRTSIDAYLPLSWEDIYEPARFYSPGEPAREEPIQRTWVGSNRPYKLPKEYKILHIPKR